MAPGIWQLARTLRWTGALLLQGAGASSTDAGCSGGLNGLHSEVGHLSPHAARQRGALGDVVRLVDVQAVRRLKHGRPLHQVQGDLHTTNPSQPCLARYEGDRQILQQYQGSSGKCV